MDDLLRDIKQTLRNIGGRPAFFATVILTLAIGIGANTAIFSIVKTVLLDPLPYPESDQLVTMTRFPWTPTEIVLDLKESGPSFEDIAGYYPQRFAITGGEQPFELEGAQVSANFFQVFRAQTAIGRHFVEEDAQVDAPPTAMMSYGLWQRRYGGSPDVIGKTLQVSGEQRQVIGVLSREFRQFGPRAVNPELWIPFEIAPTNPDGSLNWVIPLARLQSNAALSNGQTELDVVVGRFLQRHTQYSGPRWDLRLVTIKSEMVSEIRPALLLLQLAVGVILLITCVNVANLLLARFSSRQREVAIRSTMGASKGRLLKQLLTESVLLSVIGGIVGLVVMLFGLKLILSVAPQDIPRIGEVTVDFSIFLFTLLVSLVTGLVFGVLPAMTATRTALYDFLKEGGRTPAGSMSKHRISRALVIAEVTLTLVLLVGAGLLIRSFVSLSSQTPGFRTADVLTLQMRVPESRYESVPQLESFFQLLAERLSAVPGVESLAVSNNLPISRGRSIRQYIVEGETEIRRAEYGVVSPAYFRMLEIPLLQGRSFDETDRRGNLRVAVIDEAMRRAGWADRDPIGKRFRFQDGEDSWLTIVGVVDNIKGGGLARDPRPGFYISYQQRPETPVELTVGRNSVVIASAQSDVENLAEPLRQAIWQIDSEQPVPEMATLASIVSEGVSPERFRALLLGTFAAIALLLAITGIYGVIEYLVAERTHEFGIRMALGATRQDIVRRVFVWGLRLSVFGIILGLVAVFAVTRFLASLLFGVTPMDPLTVFGSILAIVLVTLAACNIPARRATRVDPIIALRSETVPAREAEN